MRARHCVRTGGRAVGRGKGVGGLPVRGSVPALVRARLPYQRRPRLPRRAVRGAAQRAPRRAAPRRSRVRALGRGGGEGAGTCGRAGVHGGASGDGVGCAAVALASEQWEQGGQWRSVRVGSGAARGAPVGNARATHRSALRAERAHLPGQRHFVLDRRPRKERGRWRR